MATPLIATICPLESRTGSTRARYSTPFNSKSKLHPSPREARRCAVSAFNAAFELGKILVTARPRYWWVETPVTTEPAPASEVTAKVKSVVQRMAGIFACDSGVGNHENGPFGLRRETCQPVPIVAVYSGLRRESINLFQNTENSRFGKLR